MTIYIHDPDQNEKRTANEPLSKKEEQAVVNFMNELIAYHQDPDPEAAELLQRFVHHYENMKEQNA